MLTLISLGLFGIGSIITELSNGLLSQYLIKLSILDILKNTALINAGLFLLVIAATFMLNPVIKTETAIYGAETSPQKADNFKPQGQGGGEYHYNNQEASNKKKESLANLFNKMAQFFHKMPPKQE
jgi:hypothetical protein